MLQATLWALALTLTAATEQTRWSRQINSYTSDMSDWVPLTGPVQRPEDFQTHVKRQVAQPRILAEPFPGFTRPTGFSQDAFPSRSFYQGPANRQLYLQSLPSVPTAPQNFLSEQGFGQSIRFGLSQPNSPLSQGFVAPPLTFDSFPQALPQNPRQSGQIRFENFVKEQRPQSPIKFDSFPKASLPLSPQAKPFNPQLQKAPQLKPAAPKFVDGYRIENASFAFQKKKPVNPQSLQKMKFENYEKPKMMDAMVNKPKSEREEVQLLYVPVESLNRGNFNFRAQNNQQLIGSDVYHSLPKPNPLPQTFSSDFQRPIQKPFENKFEQDYFSGVNSPVSEFDQVPKYSTSITSPFPTLPFTTPRPKKLKPHQPPLAVFLTQDAKKGEKVKVADVLTTLKNAKSVAVLDSVSPNNAPKVFIGPLTLSPPENYVKFELPYLSNIDGTDRKLRQLPFFVAPLSYHTPDGFAKIPFPSPHVGSVIVNSLIKDSSTKPPVADVIPNSYSASPPPFKQESQKPTFSYYSTAAPKTNPPQNQYKQSNYYSFEPQQVTSIRTKKPETTIVTAPPSPPSYFLSNNGQYNPQIQFISNQNNVSPQTYTQTKQTEQPTTPKSSTQSTKISTQQASTYPSQLLETHNPYSINQAFHLSTPLDYNNYFDDLKEGYVTTGNPAETPTTKTKEVVTEKPFQQSSPNYLQNYNPEIHYESENQNGRYPVYREDYPKNQASNQGNTEYGGLVETQAPALGQNQNVGTNEPSQIDLQSTGNPNLYNDFSNEEYKEPEQVTTTTSTTTTTTRRPTVRGRGRPRSTTTKPDSQDKSGETTSRTVTRRPLRERKPLPTRPKYEPNKITTEKHVRRPVENSNSEVTTKSSRSRTRGRVQFKPTDGDDGRDKKQNKKTDEDLAYQRDVLHQNYPVTLMERMSTVDIEAMTEPAPRISSTRNLEPNTESYDTAPAFSNEQLYSQVNTEAKEPESVVYTSRYPESQTETSYVPRLPTTREEFVYHSRSSVPVETYPTNPTYKEESYAKATTPIRAPEVISISTESAIPVTEQAQTRYSISNEYSSPIEEETTTTKSYEITKEKESEEEIQTTPASIYNRVRVRPGGMRQYQQTTTESPATAKTTKVDIRKKPQAVTYRPAFDKRRTTMRIDEIEADLKTKQVRARPDVQDRHPVYRPEPTTESVFTTSSTDGTSKRGQFRRRRPSYSATSTEASVTRKSNSEVKNRFRGRRPTDKPKDVDAQTEATHTTTSRTVPYSRYTRPRLSERYNKRPTEPTQETEDQDANFSFNRPKFVIPEEKPDLDQWSPKFAADSFKPYNPNDIQDERKIATTERKSSEDDSDLDIITAKNDYDDILVSVTPASNRLNKKVPDVPPTLEALLEQSKVTNTESASTFESMLEQVMKSLEEQDENEYSRNVMKHKGGEIGEIPPEVVSNEEAKSTTIVEREVTTETTVPETSPAAEEPKEKRRRGFWKKVQRRPASTESIEAAESQYYTNTVNQLGEAVKPSRQSHDKYADKSYEKAKVTTYKPNFQLKDLFDSEDEAEIDPFLNQDIPKLSAKVVEKTTQAPEIKTTYKESIGDYDLGTGAPDSTIPDMFYNPTTTEQSSEVGPSMADRSDGFSFMDYLFGVNNEEKDSEPAEIKTESAKSTYQTTESSFVPDEITTLSNEEDAFEFDVKKTNVTEEVNREKVDESTNESKTKVESTSVSSFMDPSNVMSTSMSYEVSHETEICFRGKCIKTSKDLL